MHHTQGPLQSIPCSLRQNHQVISAQRRHVYGHGVLAVSHVAMVIRRYQLVAMVTRHEMFRT